MKTSIISSQWLVASWMLMATSSITQAQVNLDSLGTNSWNRFKPGWSLTVNDQCAYEFVFQFEHDPDLPRGAAEFQGQCALVNEGTGQPFMAPDGEPFLSTRRFWEKFPDYVWATIGFNHLSLDWLPCGARPSGYARASYEFSFFRVSPEFRALEMQCDTLNPDQVQIPLEKTCDENQSDARGKRFFIVPGALADRNKLVNAPESFTTPENAPVPTVGLRSWDVSTVPKFASQWNEAALMMSYYEGDLAMWQPKIPYHMVSGPTDQFTSLSHRYFETTIQTLPDTVGFDYDQSDGMIRVVMVGKAQICRADFERVQEQSGFPRPFPNYEQLLNGNNGNTDTGGGDGNGGDGNGGDGNGDGSGASSISTSTTLMSLVGSLLLFHLVRW
jgi:hypothetical protein